jgi:hypothetical protein
MRMRSVSRLPTLTTLNNIIVIISLGVQEGDHKFLFRYVDQATKDGTAVELMMADEKN